MRWPDRDAPAIELAGHELRRVTAADEPALQAMLASDPAYFRLAEGAPPRPTEAHEVLTELPPGHPAERKHVWALFAADGPLAVIDILEGYPDAESWYLGLIFVAPAARDGRLGTTILASLAEHVVESGGTKLRLAVVSANLGARRLYDRLGFTFVDRRIRTAWSGAAIECDVLERALTSSA
ncbi:MAG TPA: GNAT family N-acetyltransferase [Kofleriaceae bacterium]|nr:GNAT family N-acetyltransferase [Kofleriaceae bacterium]